MRSVMRQYQEKLKKQQEQGEAPVSVTKTSEPLPGNNGSLIKKQQNDALMARAMAEDLKILKDIQSTERKEKLKADDLVPKYRAFVESCLADDRAHPILTQIMVWLFDVNDIAAAMELAEHCFKHKIPMPERFKSGLEVYAADALHKWAEARFKEGNSPEPYFSVVFNQIRDDAFDRPDAVTSKYYKLAGLMAFDKDDFENALVWLNKALDMGETVKTKRDKAAKALQKLQEEREQNEDGQGS
ncbi:phage terminase small subunit [Endozoicomonas lisbonensis]|uniref:Terminase n=1 Tax=Endozoicomonas lisbonensis TaxID=3120522 RepID=A0ABV2SI12_9GAMM